MQSPVQLIVIAVMAYTAVSFDCRAGDEGALFPAGCEQSGFKLKGDNLVFDSEPDRGRNLYLLRNASDKPLVLNHPVSNPGASAGWASGLGPGNWSALAMNIPGFELSCAESGTGGYVSVACGKVLKACEIGNAEFGPDLTGSFWVSEDRKLDALLEEIESRGISWR